MSEKVTYSQFCDSSGFPILTRQYFSFYNKEAKKIPLFFSTNENEIIYAGFFTNQTNYVFALLAKYYRPEIENIHPGSINIIRFNQNSDLLDTIIIKDDMYNWGQLYIEYSPNCDFNYILTSDYINKKFRLRAYRVDSVFNREPEIIYTNGFADNINSISPKGDIIVLYDRTQTNKLKKQYSVFYPFNSQKLIINRSNPFFGLQTENNSICFSSDGQLLFHISHDSVLQYSFRYLLSDSILKSKKLIGMIEKSSLGENQYGPFKLFPDEILYFTTTFGLSYLVKKMGDLKYNLFLTKIIPLHGDAFTSRANTALYHPHFRIESKDTVCINEMVTLKTNHIDSFASYRWVIKDSKNTILLNSYSISPDFVPTQPGVYKIQLIYRWRCNSMDSTSKILIIPNFPKIDKIKDSTICYYGSFSTKIPSNFKQVNWSDNTIGHKFETNKHGIYSVSYSDKCWNYKDTFKVNVINELYPQVNNSPIILCTQSETFNTAFQLQLGSSFKWSDGFGSLNRLISRPESYKIQFSNQCQTLNEEFEVLYTEKKTELFIPNAITPNGDQLNENWEINDPSNIKEIEWMLFNRWGEKIDEGKNTRFTFTKLISANNHNQGIYYYKLIITFQCNSIRKTYNGVFHFLN